MGAASLMGGAVTGLASGYANYSQQQIANDKAVMDMEISNQANDVALVDRYRGLESAKDAQAKDNINNDVAMQIHAAKVKGEIKAEAGASGMSSSTDMTIYAVQQQEANANMAVNVNSERFYAKLEQAQIDSANQYTSGRALMPSSSAPNGIMAALTGISTGVNTAVSMQGMINQAVVRDDLVFEKKGLEAKLLKEHQRAGTTPEKKSVREPSWLDWMT